jgi:hypothetical protein
MTAIPIKQKQVNRYARDQADPDVGENRRREEPTVFPEYADP